MKHLVKFLGLFMIIGIISACSSQATDAQNEVQPTETETVVIPTSVVTSTPTQEPVEDYVPREFISITGIVDPSQESRIELEDGAALIIPEGSTTEMEQVTLERNPAKSLTLPPLDENAMAVSDFYNVSYSGDGISSPITMEIPIDSNQVPDQPGFYTVSIPTENGWEYIPVIPENGSVTVVLENVGDPIIAWHFTESESLEEFLTSHSLCDLTIPLTLTQISNDVFEISGELIPMDPKKFFGLPWSASSKTIINQSVTLWLYHYGHEPFHVFTDENGSFRKVITVSDGIGTGENIIVAQAECSPPIRNIRIISKGSVEFNYEPPCISWFAYAEVEWNGCAMCASSPNLETAKINALSGCSSACGKTCQIMRTPYCETYGSP